LTSKEMAKYFLIKYKLRPMTGFQQAIPTQPRQLANYKRP